MSATTLAPPPPVAPPPTPPLLTAEEFVERYAGRYVDLVKGVVVEYPMPYPRHGKVCGLVARPLLNFVADHDLGHVMINDSFVRLRENPDTVRGPDLSYYSYARLPRGEVPGGLLAAIPDLVFEVRSPSNDWSEVFAKLGEYLKAGVLVVVVIDPDSATASAYRRTEFQQIFDNGDELTLPDVLPGFGVPVRQFFE